MLNEPDTTLPKGEKSFCLEYHEYNITKYSGKPLEHSLENNYT